jgi:hypothetical protein
MGIEKDGEGDLASFKLFLSLLERLSGAIT